MTRTWQFVATRVRLIANALSDAMLNVAVQDEDAATISDISGDDTVSPPRSVKGKEKADEDLDEGGMLMDEY
jgi:hypothetical protein